MSQVCMYCGTPRNDRMSCCGENHWEEDATTQQLIDALVDMNKFEIIFVGDKHGKN